MLDLDADRIAVDQEPSDLRSREGAEPALVGQRERLGRAPEELLELEVEAEIAMVDRQPADRRAGQRLGRPRQAAEDPGRALGGERRIAGQQLVRAVSPEHDLDLAACETAQQMSRQDRRVAERLVEPGRHFGQEIVGRLDRERSFVMVGPQVPGDRAGMAALVEAGILEADRVGPHVARRLDLADRGGDARGIDPTGQERRRWARPNDDGAPPRRETRSRTARPCASKSRADGLETGGSQYLPDPNLAPLPRQNMAARELAQGSPDGMRGRHIFVKKVADQALPVEGAADLRDAPGPPWAPSRRRGRRQASAP